MLIMAAAAVEVAKKESWRREAVWSRVQEFAALTRCPAMSPIVSLLIGSEQEVVEASRRMLECGFHVTAIRPPLVAPNACRLGVTLTSAHTSEDVSRLVVALSLCIPALRTDDVRMASRLLMAIEQAEGFAQGTSHSSSDSFHSLVGESILL